MTSESFLFGIFNDPFDTLVDIIIDFVIWLILFLPSGAGIPPIVGDILEEAWSWALSLDFLIATSQIPLVLGVLIGFEIGLLIWHILQWVAGLIRT